MKWGMCNTECLKHCCDVDEGDVSVGKVLHSPMIYSQCVRIKNENNFILNEKKTLFC